MNRISTNRAPSGVQVTAEREPLSPTWRLLLRADRAANESALRTNLQSLATTRTRHLGNDSNLERYEPDLWTDEFAFLTQPAQAQIQSDLFHDYRTNVDAYPKWQAWMREKQPRSKSRANCRTSGARPRMPPRRRQRPRSIRCLPNRYDSRQTQWTSRNLRRRFITLANSWVMRGCLCVETCADLQE